MSVSPDKPALASYVEDCSDDSQDEQPLAPAPPLANTARKVKRRDEASDSGYSSHTFATGSSSQSSRRKPQEKSPGFFARALGMGKKTTSTAKKGGASNADDAAPRKTAAAARPNDRSPDKPVSPKTTRRHSIGRLGKKEDLRAAAAAAAAESSPPAVKTRPVLAPVQTQVAQTNSSRRVPASATLPPVIAYGPPQPLLPLPLPLPRPPPMMQPPPEVRARHYSAGASARPRPHSYQPGFAYSYGPGPLPGPPSFGYADMPPTGTMGPPVNPSYAHPGNYPPGQPAYPVLQPHSPNNPNHIVHYSHPQTVHPSVYGGPPPPVWNNSYQAPPVLRRMSMVSAPPRPQHTIVSYPQVSQLHQWPEPRPSMQRRYSRDYDTYSAPLQRSEEYEEAMALITQDDEESYYRERFARDERDRNAMPPPPIPHRPGLGRAATTSTRTTTLTRNSSSKRRSIEPTAHSPRKTSFDAPSRPNSRPNPPTRASHASTASSELPASAIAPTPPSPLGRYSSHSQSRPASFHDGAHHDKYRAAQVYQEETGVDANTTITADAVHRALRDKAEGKPSRGTRSTRSHSSRTSSKSSDPKKQQRKLSGDKGPSSRTDRQSKTDSVTMKVGKMVLDMAGGGPVAVRHHGDNVEITFKQPSSRSRDGRSTRDREQRSVRYLPTGSSRNGGAEVEVSRGSHTRHRSHSRVSSSRRTTAATPAEESQGTTIVEGDALDRTRSKTDSRSRRSSRSGTTSRRPLVRQFEGEVA